MDRENETDLARALRRLDVAGDMAAMDKQTLSEYRDTIRDLRSQLAALQAEAARVVGPFAKFAEMVVKEHPGWDHDAFGITDDLNMKPFRAARAFLASLPTPAVVAVPIEPGEEDIEAMATHFACSEMFGLEWATTKFGPEIIEDRIRMGWTERFNDDETWVGEEGEPRTTKGKTSMRAEAIAAYRALVKRHGG